MVVGPNIHFEASLEHVSAPPLAWNTAQEQLQQILTAHEESPAEGSRFLIAKIEYYAYEGCQCFPRAIHIEYIMTRQAPSWTYHVVVWVQHRPYEYDFDVSEMRPFMSL